MSSCDGAMKAIELIGYCAIGVLVVAAGVMAIGIFVVTRQDRR